MSPSIPRKKNFVKQRLAKNSECGVGCPFGVRTQRTPRFSRDRIMDRVVASAPQNLDAPFPQAFFGEKSGKSARPRSGRPIFPIFRQKMLVERARTFVLYMRRDKRKIAVRNADEKPCNTASQRRPYFWASPHMKLRTAFLSGKFFQKKSRFFRFFQKKGFSPKNPFIFSRARARRPPPLPRGPWVVFECQKWTVTIFFLSC